MREIRPAIVDIDRFLEEAARAQQQREAERWRQELRPRAMRTFAERAAKLTWSRALLKLVIDELYPDESFTELVGNLDRVPARQWPRVIAIAVALRHSWRRDGLERVARRLRVPRRHRTRRRSSLQSTQHSTRTRAANASRGKALVSARPPASSRSAPSPQGRDAVRR